MIEDKGDSSNECPKVWSLNLRYDIGNDVITSPPQPHKTKKKKNLNEWASQLYWI